MTSRYIPIASVQTAAKSTVASVFEAMVRLYPERPALQDDQHTLTYRELGERVKRIASWLAATGLERGDRVALLAENSITYLEIMLAAAAQGYILACQNWRLLPHELQHCIRLVTPKLVLTSERFGEALRHIDCGKSQTRVLHAELAREWRAISPVEPNREVDPEDPLVILYTSGTTGLPKGAVISHRAEIVRNAAWHLSFGLAPDDTFIAWMPLYHMGGMDQSLATLLSGGKVIVLDGFQAQRLAQIAVSEPLGWLVVMPGTVDRMITALREVGVPPMGIKVCGVMADLIPRHQIAELTTLLDAPFANTFGSTETGSPPCSGNLVPVGVVPEALPKKLSPLCEVQLVDAEDREVPVGIPGEVAVRGPTLFSGYWQADEANAQDFRNGWFHMGDILVRQADGTFEFVDRAKYVIKSGGENIYPAEMEEVLLSESRVAEAAVVRQADPQWGEVPIAFVARRDDSLTAAELYRLCRQRLAGYKQPKGIRFIAFDDFPRSASGKVQRHELQARLEREP
jgi:acyl-CoA synthetase (AMP-forming)/AMP-acid ligase II